MLSSEVGAGEDSQFMANDRDRLTKVLALAMHPRTIPEEATAAFHRARDLVKANPSLAHPPAPPQQPAQSPPPQTTFKANVTLVHPDWILILVELLSKRAYQLDLKHQIGFDFSQTPTAVSVVCDGSQEACGAFERHMQRAINYINQKLSVR
jgi:hypothetical protein